MRNLALAGLTLVLTASLAVAGGQQMAAEVAPDGKSLRLHTYRCGTPASLRITGTAEGILAGKRQTIPLAISRADAEGIFTLTRQWPVEGTWVLTFAVDGGARTAAIVELEPGPELKIASQESRRKEPEPREIETVLARMASR